jgi:hypothetical protein
MSRPVPIPRGAIRCETGPEGAPVAVRTAMLALSAILGLGTVAVWDEETAGDDADS